MPSIGEGKIIKVESRSEVGEIRILSVNHGGAVFPRLKFLLYVVLDENPFKQPQVPYPGLELRDLRGELQLSPGTHALGLIEWTGPRWAVTAKQGGRQIEVICDLDEVRLDAIEQRRNGGVLILHATFWPTLAISDKPVYGECEQVRLEIPRDRWLDVLEQLQGKHRLVIEIPLGKKAAYTEAFRTAHKHLSEAQKLIHDGHFDGAGISCGQALEAVERLLPEVDKEKSAIRELVNNRLNEKRGGSYSSAGAVVRQLRNSAAHDSDPIPLTRAEANLSLSTAANIIALLGELLEKKTES